MQRIPARHYTHIRIGRMICDPNQWGQNHEVLKNEMVNAVADATPTAENHDKILKSIFEIRRKVARRTDDLDFVEMANESYLCTGKVAGVSRTYSPTYTTGQHRKLNKLARKRYKLEGLSKEQIEKLVLEGSVKEEQIHVLNGRKIKTNVRDSFHKSLAEDSQPYKINIFNIHPTFHPDILKHLEVMWQKAHRAKRTRKKLAAVAEYEWWFYQANLTRRGAASIGDSMSAILRKSIGLPLEEYRRRDYDALTLPLKEYVKLRMKEGLAA